MQNEDPIVGEVDELPAKTDAIIYLSNPRRRDGKDLPYLEESVTKVAWPIARLSLEKSQRRATQSCHIKKAPIR